MDNSGQIPIGRYGVNGKNSLYRKNRLAPAAGKRRYQPESKAGPTCLFDEFEAGVRLTKKREIIDIKSLREQKRLNHFEKAADTIGVTAEETALKLTDREFLK
ncbi:MAG: hypothetical protein CVV45_10230, partial [Spirochaetae bacterium HGW-Spirochaetae-10]